MSNNEPQLTSAIGYDTKNMIFEEPVTGEIPDSVPKIKFRRIPIKTRYQDGSVGDLIFPSAEAPNTNFSYGVSENTSQETGKVNGWVYPICLYTRDGATEYEKKWVETFNAVCEVCKDHLVENKEEIDQFDLTHADLKKLNPLWWKKEKVMDEKTGKPKQQVVPGTGPVLYAKLIHSKKQDKIMSQFYDLDTGASIDPMELLGKYCQGRSAIKIESIFIGNKISLQVKLYEQDAKILSTGMPRLLSRPQSDGRVLTRKPQVGIAPMGDDESDNEEGSVAGGSDKEDGAEGEQKEEAPKKLPVKRTVKRVVRKATAT